jgi:hypothetical protein
MCDEDLQKGQFICFRSYAKAGIKENPEEKTPTRLHIA